MRLVGVYDIEDGVDRLINWIFDQDMGVPVATEMVNAPDTGVVHSIRLTEDLFATGDKRLVNYKTYYYMALAYGYNNFQPYNPDPNQQSGQAYPYKAGRKSASGAIRSWSGIPHPPARELVRCRMLNSVTSSPLRDWRAKAMVGSRWISRVKRRTRSSRARTTVCRR